ncbi:hypothetical protein LTS18_010175, partial [Coniosporium uncinatum]
LYANKYGNSAFSMGSHHMRTQQFVRWRDRRAIVRLPLFVGLSLLLLLGFKDAL